MSDLTFRVVEAVPEKAAPSTKKQCHPERAPSRFFEEGRWTWCPICRTHKEADL